MDAHLHHESITFALLAGIGISIMAGPLGSFLIWRRIAYFGDSLAHSALLGIALGMFFHFHQVIGVIATCLVFATLLVSLQRGQKLAADTLMAILAHTALAAGLIALSLTSGGEHNHEAMHHVLFGDILHATKEHLYLIYGSAAIGLGVIYKIWRSLLSTTINEELAYAEGINTVMTQFIFVLLMALFVGIAMQVIGILLLTSLMIIPAATARTFSKNPGQMAIAASFIGMVNVAIGLGGSQMWHLPTTPSIVMAAALFFALAGGVSYFRKKAAISA